MALGEARVEVVPDLSKFERSLIAGVRDALGSMDRVVESSMDKIGQNARSAGEKIGAAFRDAGREAKNGLDLIVVGDTFGNIESEARRAGEGIEIAFAEGARGAAADLARIADGNPFATLDQEAERAGEGIEAAFAEAARGAKEDLADIDDGNPFAGVERDAERAGESIERSFREAARQSEAQINGIGGRFRGMAAGIGAALAGIGLGAGFGFAIKQASDLGESVNAVNVTFGAAAGGIRELAQNASTALGLTEADFNSLAVRFSAFATAVAGDGGDVVAVMDDLTTRAADFASVMNLEVNEAAQLFQSGLAGETEPLRRFGLDLSAARVEAYALAEGIAAPGQAMTEQQKILARYGLLMQQTASTAGDFANTSTDLANGLRILKAQAIEAASGFGQALLPGLKDVVASANTLIVDLAEPLRTLGTVVGEAMGPLFEAIGPALGEALRAVVQIISDFAQVVGAIAPVIAPLVAIIGEFATLISGVFAAAFKAVAPFIESFGRALKDAATIMGDTFGRVLGAITPALEAVAPVMESLGKIIGGLLVGAVEALAPALEILVVAFAEITEVVAGALQQAMPELSRALKDFMRALQPILPLLAEFVAALVRSLLPVLPTLVQSSVDLSVAFLDIVTALMPLIELWLQLTTLIVDYGLAPMVEQVALGFQHLANVFTDIVNVGGSVLGFLGGVVNTLGGSLNIVTESTTASANAMGNASTQAMNHLASLQALDSGIPTLIANVDAAAESFGEFDTAISTASTTAASIVETELARIEQAATDLQTGVETATASAAQSFLDLSEKGKASVEDFINETIADTARLTEFQTNVTTIASQTSGEFATYLLSMGESGENLVKDLADPGKATELQTAFEAWVAKTEAAGTNMTTEFAKVDPAFKKTLQGVAGLTNVEMVKIEIEAAKGAWAVATALMDGMANGIVAKSPQVKTAIADAVRGAIAEAKRVAGISSPSQVTEDEIGRPMMQGILKGITEDGRLIEIALVSAVLDPLNDMRRESDNLTRVTTKTGRQFVIQYTSARAAVDQANSSIDSATDTIRNFGNQSTQTITSWSELLRSEARAWGVEFESVVDRIVVYAETKFRNLASNISSSMGSAVRDIGSSLSAGAASGASAGAGAGGITESGGNVSDATPTPTGGFNPAAFTSFQDIIDYATGIVNASGSATATFLRAPRTPPGLASQFSPLAQMPTIVGDQQGGTSSGASSPQALPASWGKSAPTVNIQSATFVAPMDAEIVAQKVNAAERARSFAS